MTRLTPYGLFAIAANAAGTLGVEQLSRLQIYLVVYVAVALLAQSFWALVFVPIGVVALSWGAIRPEERYLSGKFGSEYQAYRARVRRWL